jgi:nucleoside-diphosphate-sugar epimerase
MNVLVTGASGFVGKAFVERFAGDGEMRIHGIGRRPSSEPWYSAIDLSQPFDLAFRPDVVVHCAARSSPWGTRAEFEAANVEATRNVIAFCERSGMPRLVHVSTTAVFYANRDQLDLTEESPIGPTFVNAYAATKRAAELLVQRYAGSWIILRPRAVFGPGDTTLFPRIERAARAGRLPLLRRAGAPARSDLIYVDTLCDYIAAAARSALTGAYNLTNAEPVETQAFLLDVLHRLGVPPPARSVDARLAFALAGALETGYRFASPHREPPVTRFGIAALAYSKTFDVRNAVAAFGPPSVSMDEGVEHFVRWARAS